MHQYDTMTEPELREHFNAVGRALKQVLPPNTGFFLLAGPFGNGIAQYLSNVKRDGAIRWLRETADRLEADDTVPRS